MGNEVPGDAGYDYTKFRSSNKPHFRLAYYGKAKDLNLHNLVLTLNFGIEYPLLEPEDFNWN